MMKLNTRFVYGVMLSPKLMSYIDGRVDRTRLYRLCVAVQYKARAHKRLRLVEYFLNLIPVSYGFLFIASNFRPFMLPIIVALFFPWLIGTLVLWRHRRKLMLQDLSRRLRKMGVYPNMCFRCGYKLQGAMGQACSECGERLIDES